MPIDFEGVFLAAYRENVRDVRRAVAAGEMDEKVQNFCALHGFDREEVIEAIQNSNIVGALFAINPNKQNIYERTAADAIRAIPDVSDFRNLGTRELYVVSGGVHTRQEIQDAGTSSQAKTLDFQWRYGGMEFYASHKYTRQSGGSQDSQFKDLEKFIEQCRSTQRRDTHFVALADGPYYRMPHNAGRTRLEYLQDVAGGRRVHACTTDDLETVMRQIAAR